MIQTLTGHKGGVTSVAFAPNGRQVASGSDDNTVRLWEISTGKAVWTLAGQSVPGLDRLPGPRSGSVFAESQVVVY
jgi:WD40 repeat protein